MKLTLDPLDLKPKYQTETAEGTDQACNTSQVTFDKLNPEAQAAVCAAGGATFHSFDRRTYITIHPPAEKKWFCRSFIGSFEGGGEGQDKARRRAIAFMNQNKLGPEETHLDSGWCLKSGLGGNKVSILTVYVWYRAYEELPYENPIELGCHRVEEITSTLK